MTKRQAVDFMAGFKAMESRDSVQRTPRGKTPLPAEAAPNPRPITEDRQKSRVGKVSITYYVDPVVRKQLAQLALDRDTAQAVLFGEAINLLFEKYGLPPIAKPGA